MSGHSHWATIKRKKGASDAKRGQIYTRLTREIVMAAREGGGDMDSNFRLRLAVEKARDQNMPKENIERAVKRGTGESKDGAAFEEIYYEGYGPNGVALIIECVTENRNRTVAELRHMLSRLGGNLGEAGSVGWQFKRIAFFSVASSDFDKIFELAVEGGADDVSQDEDSIEIIAPVESFKKIIDLLRAAGVTVEEAGLRMIPNQEMELSVEDTLQAMRAIETIEDLDDVQNVFSNLRISDEAVAAMEAE
ncbi:MAG TPA: YebC/PmpR family DNA-binding transcriptional regulator [Anaerolineaceae bacterium]|nr:YebC/PmpR family DNA-binding transcriptional regulator [Longilinea sp.]NMD31714.1 YebC/PmpR family DNA-binding transcriptional regulator [Chloroflexota bacterium]HNS63784.1 YebC/PmpR family DNA-binding transcriptional regulator [Anaerolineaceae bacterium]HNZ01606.1 YebC/PmpR family DNA-binding transcriptional regulator [Anaerolineaceae bacterium]HOH20737.1 YebC/PmpR family DNA-binding transcriptional regulator [Anaerolineaceae bacterium]